MTSSLVDGFPGPSFNPAWTPVVTNGSFPFSPFDFGVDYGVDGVLWSTPNSVGQSLALRYVDTTVASYRSVSAKLIPFTPHAALITYNRRSLLEIASSTWDVVAGSPVSGDWLIDSVVALQDNAAGSLEIITQATPLYYTSGPTVHFTLYTQTYSYNPAFPYYQLVHDAVGNTILNKSADGISWSLVNIWNYLVDIPPHTTTNAFGTLFVQEVSNPFIYSGTGRAEIDNLVYASAGGGRPTYTPGISGTTGGSSSTFVRKSYPIGTPGTR